MECLSGASEFEAFSPRDLILHEDFMLFKKLVTVQKIYLSIGYIYAKPAQIDIVSSLGANWVLRPVTNGSSWHQEVAK